MGHPYPRLPAPRLTHRFFLAQIPRESPVAEQEDRPARAQRARLTGVRLESGRQAADGMAQPRGGKRRLNHKVRALNRKVRTQRAEDAEALHAPEKLPNGM